MRLLNTKTGRFQWFEDPREVRYAILSHVWSKTGEKSLQDVQKLIDAATPDSHGSVLHALPGKLKSFCEVAQAHGFELGWADSCCIDKTSSTELSEAITSMYDWYRYADMCFAYLHDVNVGQGVDAARRNQAICESQWFYRGWTLQELLAPSILLFLSSTWEVIASKQTCAAQIASIFHIDRDVLTSKRPLDEVSVARRMSWAASRNTTRKEDEAYCLMGIFGVNIPIIYGEGRHAFTRLQEEIIRTIPDQSIFAWGRILGAQHPFQFGRPDDAAVESVPDPRPVDVPSTSNQYLLASSPKDFPNSLESSNIIHLSRDELARRLTIPQKFTYQVFTATAYGIHVRLPLVAVVGTDHHELFPTHLALLACETQVNRRLLALLLRPQDGNLGFSVGATVVGNSIASLARAGLDPADLDGHYRAVYLSLDQVRQILRARLIRMATLYLPHRPLRGVSQTERDQCRLSRRFRDFQDGNFEVHLAGWSRRLLSLDGSRLAGDDDRIVPQSRRLHPDQAPWLEIEYKGSSGKTYRINIQIGRCECPLGLHSGARTTLLGVLVWSPHALSSLENMFKEAYHRPNHPAHLYSWAYHDGVASTSVELQPPHPSRERITVCLTLYHRPDDSSPNVFELGVEVTSCEVAILESPPLTAENSRSSVHPPGWDEKFDDSLSRRYAAQESPLLTSNNSYVANADRRLLPPSRRHSLSGSVIRVPLPTRDVGPSHSPSTTPVQVDPGTQSRTLSGGDQKAPTGTNPSHRAVLTANGRQLISTTDSEALAGTGMQTVRKSLETQQRVVPAATMPGVVGPTQNGHSEQPGGAGTQRGNGRKSGFKGTLSKLFSRRTATQSS